MHWLTWLIAANVNMTPALTLETTSLQEDVRFFFFPSLDGWRDGVAMVRCEHVWLMCALTCCSKSSGRQLGKII